MGTRDVREGPECCVMSTDLFPLGTTAYGNRPVAGSNQKQHSLPQGLEYLPLHSLSSQFQGS